MEDCGRLDCIVGCMKSGKSSELLRRLSIESEIGYKVLYINTKKDTRCIEGSSFSTHNPLFTNGISLQNTTNIISLFVLNLKEVNVEEYSVIGVDEAQFFDDLEVVIEWVDKLKKE